MALRVAEGLGWSAEAAQSFASRGTLELDDNKHDDARATLLHACELVASTKGPLHPRGVAALSGLEKVYKLGGDGAARLAVLVRISQAHKAVRGTQDPKYIAARRLLYSPASALVMRPFMPFRRCVECLLSSSAPSVSDTSSGEG